RRRRTIPRSRSACGKSARRWWGSSSPPAKPEGALTPQTSAPRPGDDRPAGAQVACPLHGDAGGVRINLNCLDIEWVQKVIQRSRRVGHAADTEDGSVQHNAWNAGTSKEHSGRGGHKHIARYGHPSAGAGDVHPRQAAKRLGHKRGVVLLDVRPRQEIPEPFVPPVVKP